MGALCRPNDAYIDRRGGIPTLYGNEGMLCQFPPGWSDSQILYALAFANAAYLHGVENGKRLDAAEKARRRLAFNEA